MRPDFLGMSSQYYFFNTQETDVNQHIWPISPTVFPISAKLCVTGYCRYGCIATSRPDNDYQVPCMIAERKPHDGISLGIAHVMLCSYIHVSFMYLFFRLFITPVCPIQTYKNCMQLWLKKTKKTKEERLLCWWLFRGPLKWKAPVPSPGHIRWLWWLLQTSRS